MTESTAMIAGATGLIGGMLLEALLTTEKYDFVTVCARRPLASNHPHLRTVIADFAELPAPVAEPSLAAAFCCLGSTMKQAGSKDRFRQVDFSHVVAFANYALAAGAKQFLLVSALGADASSPIFYNRVKGEAEDAVAALPFEAVHLFRPSLLLGPRKETRAGERLAQPLARLAAPLLIGPLRKTRPIRARTVANAMRKAARSGAQGVHIHYFEDMA